jgi:chemotaxis protein MotB
MYKYLIFTLAIALSVTACVSTNTYQAALDELSSARQELDTTNQDLNRTRIDLDETRRDLIDLEVRNQDLANTVDKLDAEQEKLNLQLALSKEAQAEADRRNEIYAQFVDRLQTMIDGGQLSVKVEDGRIAIQLPDDILFDSGRARLKQNGKKTLGQIAEVLSQFKNRRFQIEGHTDNTPINSTRFPSNWELSSARALAVLHVLIEAGISPKNLSAAGFGEFQPRAENTSPQGRQQNRRIEIVMLPDLDVIAGEIPDLSEP